MKIQFALVLIPAALAALLAGCNNNSSAIKPEVRATVIGAGNSEAMPNLAKLSPEDRKLAEEQKTCPIAGGPLGSKDMGVPIKIMLNDQPVFLCCASCERKAKADPEKTLKDVAAAKAK